MFMVYTILVVYIGGAYLLIRLLYEMIGEKQNKKKLRIKNKYYDMIKQNYDSELEKTIECQIYYNNHCYRGVQEDCEMAKHLEILRKDRAINLVKKTPNKQIYYRWKQDYSDKDMLRLILAIDGKFVFDDMMSIGFVSPDENYTKNIYRYMKAKHNDIKLIKIKNAYPKNGSLYSYAWIFGDIEHSFYTDKKLAATYYEPCESETK